jgi:hypothetical protein
VGPVSAAKAARCSRETIVLVELRFWSLLDVADDVEKKERMEWVDLLE